MKISLMTVPISPGRDHDAPIINALADRCERADAGGVSAIYFPEHHFDDYIVYSDPFTMAASVGARLRRAHVGLAIAVAAFHHPVQIAERANLINILTKGRFILGVGSGGIPLESAGLGVDTATQSALLDQSMEAVTALWAKSPEDAPLGIAVGHHRGVVHQRLMPGPWRGAPPMIKIACARPERAQLAAAKGWGAFLRPNLLETYQSALAQSTHGEAVKGRCRAWTSVQFECQVGETDEEARREAKKGLEGRARWMAQQFAMERRFALHDADIQGKAPDVASDAYLERHVIYGSPDTVIAKLRAWQERGLEEMTLQIDFGINDEARRYAIDRTLDLLTAHVIPAFAPKEKLKAAV